MEEKYMNIAIDNAKKALDCGEVPVGCVIVKNNNIIASTYNLKEKYNDSTCHAEILAIKEASKILNNWRLDDCDMYVSLDPCPMCAGAIKNARINNVYSAYSHTVNNYELINLIFNSKDNNKKVNFVTNLYVDKSFSLLNLFFKYKRNS